MNAPQHDPALVIAQVLDLQRSAFLGEMQPSLAVRQGRLARLLAMVRSHEHEIIDAIDADFGGRSRHESQLTEIFMAISGIRQQQRMLKRWMRGRSVRTPLHMLPARSRLVPQPLGVVGVIGAWNYPCQLTLLPAAAALAAGNRVMIKPSELSPRFSALLAELVGRYFTPEEMAVVEGGVETSRAFTALPFDHLLFTGSTAVGREVAQAAARNLTPVTLELGGKSPVIIDSSSDLRAAATSVAHGKLFNAGQTCVAPDYVLVPRAQLEAFVGEMRQAAARMFACFQHNPDYTSIVSQRHYDRLQSLVAGAEAAGARVVPLHDEQGPAAGNAGQRRMLPVMLLNVQSEMPVMREEIFGPVLPVLAYDTLEEAIGFINRRERPLALYWFGRDKARREQVLANTISGGVTVNDVMWHAAQENLPFGGVGASGMGSYHGEHGFKTFSKEKPVFQQARLNGFGLFRPPYGRVFESLANFLKRYF